MIGSFWNLCRACPSMPVDKLHSEYRSTYRWHEYTGGSRPEVIKKPPVANQFASSADHFFSKSTEEEKYIEGKINEPPLPRRKKCPELAYKTHEFISCDQVSAVTTKNEINSTNRARSEVRGTPASRRSKSEGPHRIPNGHAYVLHDVVDAAMEKSKDISVKAGESSGLFKKTISKLSTEYRIQFIWPYSRKEHVNESEDAVDLPRKSLSMGAIKSTSTQTNNVLPTVHKKRSTPKRNEATVQELEPLVNNAEEKKVNVARPFSIATENKYKHGTTHKEDFGFAQEKSNKTDSSPLMNGGCDPETISWYKDVIELRKKAGEYKSRGWGIEIKPDVYNKQKELWDQVSRRSSLSALSLASSVHNRSISKEEKEKENNKKTSPTKGYAKAQFFDNKLVNESGRYHNIRHHLERTTGLDVEDGALLPSPIREKLLPTIPKSKDDESYNSQRGSPKKGVSSRHGSPQKSSPQKSASPKKSAKQGRSQSVGPTSVGNQEGSPKRQIRCGSAVPVNNTSVPKTHKKTPASTPTIVERRPRPTTLSTSNHSRKKSTSLPPPSGRAHSVPATTTTTTANNHHQNHQQQSLPNETIKKLSPSSLNIPNLKKSYKTPKKHQRPKSTIFSGSTAIDPMTESTINFDQLSKSKGQDKKTAENDDDTDKEGGTSISSASPLPVHEIIEHIVKSPPEPTRVKSPEQIIMRSPDPVNWTVPLDTGKTFTVTQNVRDGILGEPIIRPHSEFKASTSTLAEKPPPAPQSAPPELAEQANLEACKDEKDSEAEDVKISSLKINDEAQKSVQSIGSDVRYDKPVPGSTLRCLDDPAFDPEINSPAGNRTIASDVLDKARDRFDRFWGGTKEENV